MSPYSAIGSLLPVFAAGILFPVFLSSFLHKYRNKAEFIEVLNQYRIVPESLSAHLYPLFLALEFAVFMGLPFSVSRDGTLGLAAVLLALYGVAIAINLMRGRHEISCGCGGPGETIAWWMVGRNGALAAFAAGCLFPGSSAPLQFPGAITGFALGMTATILAAAASTLARSATLDAPFTGSNASRTR